MWGDSAVADLSTERVKATAIGFSSIIMWGMLALLTSLTKGIPPLQLTSMTFAVAFCVGIFFWIIKGHNLKCFRQPIHMWLNGIFGLFGYHMFYFVALKRAPVIEASLIAYLWPLFIVIFSALLPNEKLRWFHLGGALVGFAGAAVLILKGGTFSLKQEYFVGYMAAFSCSLIWSTYSVISRGLGESPTELVGGFCGVTALLSAFCHLAFEKTVTPTITEWLAIVGLGIGPVGAAFFAWDYGVKKGNIKLLGTLSYAAPLISTVLLVSFGRGESNWKVVVACLMIVSGAALAAKDTIKGLLETESNKGTQIRS
jgi:drug/metabolite transporter (DMT)-like permease